MWSGSEMSLTTDSLREKTLSFRVITRNLTRREVSRFEDGEFDRILD